MVVAVLGATGTLGRRVVRALADAGHEPIVLSRRKGEGGELERRVVDVATGFGLEEGLAGAAAVVDAVNDQKQARHVLAQGTPKLIAAAEKAGVGHLLSVSIVGCDRVPIGYYRVKVAQEEAVEAGSVPWTILRATQFHQLLDTMLKRAARSRIAPRGAARFQPVDPGIVAARIAELLTAGPSGRAAEVTGPRVETLTGLGAAWREARGKRFLLPLPVPAFGGAGRALAAGALTAPETPGEGSTWAEWLAAST
jgi:uncharacterized protein YbjT (DUF2867 family)